MPHERGANEGKYCFQKLQEKIRDFVSASNKIHQLDFEQRLRPLRPASLFGRVDRKIVPLDGLKALAKNKKHTLEAVVDRLVIRKGQGARVTDSVETALRLGDGRIIALQLDDERETIYSERLACEDCGISFPDLTPQSFSFNSHSG